MFVLFQQIIDNKSKAIQRRGESYFSMFLTNAAVSVCLFPYLSQWYIHYIPVGKHPQHFRQFWKWFKYYITFRSAGHVTIELVICVGNHLTPSHYFIPSLDHLEWRTVYSTSIIIYSVPVLVSVLWIAEKCAPPKSTWARNLHIFMTDLHMFTLFIYVRICVYYKRVISCINYIFVYP